MSRRAISKAFRDEQTLNSSMSCTVFEVLTIVRYLVNDLEWSFRVIADCLKQEKGLIRIWFPSSSDWFRSEIIACRTRQRTLPLTDNTYAQSRRKDLPHPSVGGPHACSGASCCVGEPFWAQQNAKNLLVAGPDHAGGAYSAPPDL